MDAVGEGLLDRGAALATIDAGKLDALLHPTFDPDSEFEVLARGIAASPGAAKGAIVFTADEAVKRGGDGEDVILVRPFTEAEDVAGFHAARGILTSEGGKASHAALVARGMGRPCVCGVSALDIDLAAQTVSVDGRELKAGDHVAIDGSEGTVTTDDVALIEPEISDEFRTVLEWSDELRRLQVRANADNPVDAKKAREFGAEGIGLCRTEHMFFGSDRDSLVKEMFLAAEQWRRAHLAADDGADIAAVDEKFRGSLAALGELQRADFEGIFKEMAGLEVTIRLARSAAPRVPAGRALRGRAGRGPGAGSRAARGEPDAGDARGAARGAVSARLRDAGEGDRRGGGVSRRDRATTLMSRSCCR